jgi:hypothetical protein
VTVTDLSVEFSGGESIFTSNHTKHQLIFDVNGKQLTSGEIASGGSGLLSFKPGVTGVSSIIVYCLSHPTTIKGIIQVWRSTKRVFSKIFLIQQEVDRNDTE